MDFRRVLTHKLTLAFVHEDGLGAEGGQTRVLSVFGLQVFDSKSVLSKSPF